MPVISGMGLFACSHLFPCEFASYQGHLIGQHSSAMGEDRDTDSLGVSKPPCPSRPEAANLPSGQVQGAGRGYSSPFSYSSPLGDWRRAIQCRGGLGLGGRPLLVQQDPPRASASVWILKPNTALPCPSLPSTHQSQLQTTHSPPCVGLASCAPEPHSILLRGKGREGLPAWPAPGPLLLWSGSCLDASCFWGGTLAQPATVQSGTPEHLQPTWCPKCRGRGRAVVGKSCQLECLAVVAP